MGPAPSCYSLPWARVVHGLQSRVAKSWEDEPGAFDVHARICWGPGWVTTLVYPAPRDPRDGSSITGRAQSSRIATGLVIRMPRPTGMSSTVSAHGVMKAACQAGRAFARRSGRVPR